MPVPSPGAGFIIKLNPAGDTILYSEFTQNFLFCIAADATGALYMAGSAGIGITPTPGVYTYGSGDLFVMKLSPNGSSIVFASIFGGN
jgi:hypothetical protein